MAEPHSTVLAGALYGAGVSSVTMFFGAQVDALVAGLVAAILASIWMETIDNKRKAASAVILSALLAGYGSPVAAQWIAFSVSGISITDQLRIVIALMIGASCPRLVPLVLQAFGKRVQGGQS
ncbi:MAG: hypothetical protein WC742_12645 [Gallionellaceae bacterium]|jgi:hypothetical protein